MKLQTIIALILVLILGSCESNKNKIIINGKVIGEIPDKIIYTLPINGTSHWDFQASVIPDSLGNFQICVESENAIFMGVAIQYEVEGTLIVEPGSSYNIIFDVSNEEKKFIVLDQSKEIQELYQKFQPRSFIQDEALVFVDDTVATEIITTINKKRDLEIEGFEKLYKEKKISEQIYRLAITDREVYYDAILGYVIWIKGIKTINNRGNLLTPEFIAIWKELFENPHFKNEYLKRSLSFTYYAENYLNYMEYVNGDFTKEKADKIYESNPNTYYVNKAKKYLPAEYVEDYLAVYLYNALAQKDFEKELISLFNDFKIKYPKSEYLPSLIPPIEEIEKFYKKRSSNPKIEFIENYQNLKSLKEIAEKVNRKIIFVDVWATWCSPCKEEFEYKEDLKKLLEKYDIPIVYISMDKDKEADRWQKMVYYYNLEGVHLRVNEQLHKLLAKKYNGSGSFGIPWYFFMDNNGNFLIKHANRPSSIKELEQEIRSLL